MTNPIICVDFDGVIHSYTSGWKGIDVIPDPPVEGAIDWILMHLPIPEAVSAMGAEYSGPEVQIYSSRSKDRKGIKAMKNWFMLHGVPSPYFTDDILKFPTEKPAAFLTIDDRAICFEGKFPTTDEIMGFKPWNKGGRKLREEHTQHVERSVGAMMIADGEEGWEKIPIDCPMLESVALLRVERDQLASLGATNKFPEGKLVAEDEGELKLAIGHDQDNVMLNFGKPVAWLGLPRDKAIEFAKVIMHHALQVRE